MQATNPFRGEQSVRQLLPFGLFAHEKENDTMSIDTPASFEIPNATITRYHDTERFAQLLSELYRAAGNNPVELSTEIRSNDLVQAYRLDIRGNAIVYAKTTFDLSQPFQELWFRIGNDVIKVQDSDLVMFGEAIESYWRSIHSPLTLHVYADAITQLKLRLALLAARTEHQKIQSARFVLG